MTFSPPIALSLCDIAYINSSGNVFWFVDVRSYEQHEYDIMDLSTACLKCRSADGILFLLPGTVLRIINSDLSEAQCCGNGLIATAHFLYQRHHQKHATITTYLDKKQYTTLYDASVAVSFPPITTFYPFDLLPQCYCFDVGVWHTVLFVPSLKDWELQAQGVLHHPGLPPNTNITIASIKDPTTVYYGTLEHGVGPTQACGTGAISTALGAALLYSLSSPLTLLPPSQSPLSVKFKQQHGIFSSIELSGSAKIEVI